MKAALITGSSGNLGKAVAEKFFSAGYQVSGTVKSGEAFAIARNGVMWEDTTVDLRQEEEAAAFVAAAIRKHKSITTAVLTVGGFAAGDVNSTGVENITQQIQLNFETAYNVAKPLFMHMKQQGGGKLYLVGSVPGAKPAKAGKSVAYGLSKSLLFYLAELLNEEGKADNITVKVIVPSVIDTPQNREAMPGADFSQWAKPAAIAGIIYAHAAGEEDTDAGELAIYV